ncbi:MAG: hypothetical protein RL097_448 [Candidatus Parcubacteria bacterium]
MPLENSTIGTAHSNTSHIVFTRIEFCIVKPPSNIFGGFTKRDSTA